MALTVGSGPFGHAPAGRFNADLPDQELLVASDTETGCAYKSFASSPWSPRVKGPRPGPPSSREDR